jgi:hypothetical protein
MFHNEKRVQIETRSNFFLHSLGELCSYYETIQMSMANNEKFQLVTCYIVALVEAVTCGFNGFIGGYCDILRRHKILNTKRLAKTEDALPSS